MGSHKSDYTLVTFDLDLWTRELFSYLWLRKSPILEICRGQILMQLLRVVHLT